MRTETGVLIASCVLFLVNILLASHAASWQRGYRWAASARDAEIAPLTGVAGRLERASRNFQETFAIFVAAILLVIVRRHGGALSEWGASLYFLGRLAYLPLYAAGVPLVRSLAWNVACGGIILLLIAAARPS